MSGAWTPGPWALDGKTLPNAQFVGGAFHRITSSDAHPAFVPDWSGDDAEAAEAMANAHLIAAAPHMAEALKNLIDRYVEVVTTPDCSCSPDDYDVQKARAALAKARGEA